MPFRTTKTVSEIRLGLSSVVIHSGRDASDENAPFNYRLTQKRDAPCGLRRSRNGNAADQASGREVQQPRR
ncbi:unnamed protein product [Soboliphyme baturini]|uniref:Diguanylate cyclase n=1 Tax=Soboliphyme baturini TaxID=241478 RepID=A0A183IJ28_9BILA|nr:unnamed protein product [Soboliphyme baturini]